MANDGSWTLEDGEVICRQLGYDIPSKFDQIVTFKDTFTYVQVLQSPYLHPTPQLIVRLLLYI